MSQIKHTHKLKRHRFKSGSSVFFCALDCTFKISPALAEGKKSICWRCGEEFIMSEYSIRLAKPHCEACHKSKDVKDLMPSLEDVKNDVDTAIAILPSQMTLQERLRAAVSRKSSVSEEDI